MGKYDGQSVKEATLLAPIHTQKSGHIKVNLSPVQTPTSKPVQMVMQDQFVELTTDKKEVILVPYTFFSHLVPKNG